MYRVSFVIQYENRENLEKYASLIASSGYNGIEIGIKDPRVINHGEIKDIISKFNLSVPALGTGRAFTEDKVSLSDNNEMIRMDAIERLKAHIDLASRLSSMVIVGLIRGNTSNDQDINLVRDALRDICEYGNSKGVRVLLEPINRYEVNWLNTVEDTYNFIKDSGLSNTGLLIDTFHMNIEEPSIASSIFRFRDLVWHVHIADSNRLSPGMGHIDFKDIFRVLSAIDYNGFISAELINKPSVESSITQTMKYLKGIL
ncbi:MAG: sugar phosphate isomerase/epimerase [Dictyoglomi bacterium]|nr:sugar phosphate isomerase/epimerase [Dictyoglomota bacterium]